MISAETVDVHDRYHNQDIAFLRHQNDKKPTHQPEKLISKFVNGLRLMPPGSPYPCIYDIYRTPYVIEPLDNMSPYSKIRNTAVKKSVQSAFTAGGGENTIAYYCKERPAYIQYMSGTDALLKKFNTGRLAPLAQSCGIRFFSQDTKRHNRSTGDTATYKEFPGGKLTLGSLQSEASMRQESVQIMIRDEIDLIETQMTSGEGNPLKVSDGRLVAYGDRAKTLDYSTPREYGNSLIDIQYNKGDKRKFFVKCPNCQKEQWLVMGTEKSNYGLKGEYKAGRLIQGWYQCFHCHDAVFESSKMKMLLGGFWAPTVEDPPDKYFRSYHLPAFYSPPGMTSWSKMRKEFDEASEEGDDGMRSFTNLYLAKSFRPSGERPKFQSVIEIRSTYNSGTVPAGIMYLTAAGDVQQGRDIYKDWSDSEIIKAAAKHKSQGDAKKLQGMPRIEFEVVGHGAIFRTASIIYKIFYGRIDDYQAGAWQKLTEWMQATSLSFKRKDGFEFNVKMIFIDSGYGKYTDLVYFYCDPLPMTYAIKGARTQKQDKLKLTNIDEQEVGGNITRFKLSKSGSYSIVLINANYYKGHIYRLLKNKFKTGEDQPPNSHQTPSDYPDDYFRGLTAEEQKTDGSFHNIAQRPNEPLDILVYNKAGADFFIEGIIVADREMLKQKRNITNKEKLRELVNRDTVTARFERELRKRGW